MKTIMMSIRPQYVAKILNGEKTIEIRKRFPKNYIGWVYIYCCAEDKNGYLIRNKATKKMEYTYNGFIASVCWLANSKLVARFWCDKVEEIHCNSYGLETSEHWYRTTDKNEKELLEKSCLGFNELDNYLNWSNGCAIHIDKVEIFDRPKEINEFYAYSDRKLKLNYHQEARWLTSLTRAPQNYCFIEV